MKITIYTITDCKFSQAEKQYLQSKQIQFDEKNLEANRDYLTEMLNISNNFAGTPVTKIEKDDGQIIVLKGFTQDEFDKALAIDPNAPKQAPMPIQQDMPPQSPPQATAPMPQEQADMPAVPSTPPPMPMNQQPDMMQQPMPVPEPQMQQSPVQPQPVQQDQMMNMAAPQPMAPAPMPMNQQPDMMQQPPVPPQPMQQNPMLNTVPPQAPSQPAEDQALNSVLQNLQSRAGDTAQ